MKDGLKAPRTEPRDEENNRLENHFQKAEMNSNQGIFLMLKSGKLTTYAWISELLWISDDFVILNIPLSK